MTYKAVYMIVALAIYLGSAMLILKVQNKAVMILNRIAALSVFTLTTCSGIHVLKDKVIEVFIGYIVIAILTVVLTKQYMKIAEKYRKER